MSNRDTDPPAPASPTHRMQLLLPAGSNAIWAHQHALAVGHTNHCDHRTSKEVGQLGCLGLDLSNNG